MVKGDEIMGSHQEDKERLNMFRYGCACNWIPTPSSAPAQDETKDGMVTWEHFMCHGIVGDIDVKQDSTFQIQIIRHRFYVLWLEDVYTARKDIGATLWSSIWSDIIV
eukprot:2912441-Ditylum_brightwellii.AAC.1